VTERSPRRVAVVAAAIVIALSSMVAAILLGIWLYRDTAWLRNMPEDCWVVAVRREGTHGVLDLYEPARDMTLWTLEKLNAEYPGQFEWHYGRPTEGQTWPDYGASMCAFSRSKEGVLPSAYVVLQTCVKHLKGASGPWLIAVRDDQGNMAGPVMVTVP
jgi:hypothetical protein